MSWSGDAEFARAEHVPVRLSAERARSGDSEFAVETVSGFARTAGRFAYVVVKGAGHLVPMDRPAVAAGMMGSFVEGALRGEDADRWFVRGERLEGRGSGREASAGTGSGLRRE
jgi:carboxypeptidase C (cathepsin A)